MSAAALALSPRLKSVLDALPLQPGLRVLEIGCGPGALARGIAEKVGDGAVLGIDRSEKAIAQAEAGNDHANLSFRVAKVEDFTLGSSEPPYDLAVAIRVGALDGRHPEIEARALDAIAGALVPGGKLLIDGGDPLREVKLPG